MESIWGEIDFIGKDHAFDLTDYYESEMGSGVQRRMLSFKSLIPAEDLKDLKLRCNAIEKELLGPGGRSVNLDVGYLDHNKVILASVKEAGQKLYLGEGVYADFTLRYGKGKYQPFEWTFPDFKAGRYDAELLQIRSLYLSQIRKKNLSTHL